MKKKAKNKGKRKDQAQIALSVVEQAIGGKLVEKKRLGGKAEREGESLDEKRNDK
jgi:hypothetical protein